ncbi:hypothetical protein [Lysinibacillus sphaericus]|uniref:hypothetical protein n=1 Tax=Lysinibacillus sphaericus TaxID=1421 RepID=UPI001CC1988F|nr:hypothetical protein [Lysinibacillus sphaericus]
MEPLLSEHDSSCCCRYVSTTLSRKNHLLPQAAHQTPPGTLLCAKSEATATNVFCAKAKRQQQMFYFPFL